jgi:O-antigen/teichoic acid export membrane protein
MNFYCDKSKILKTAISTKVIKGSFWVLLLRITNRVLGLIRTAVLARLLLPEHFGLIGIAVLTISILETFSQPGLGVALIQKKENIEKYLNTAWTISIIRSILIYGIIYISSPLVSIFFREPEAVTIIRVFGISVIIAGIRNVGVIYFQKELDFKKQYIYELSIILGNIVVAIPAAFIMKNVWALVLGGIGGSLTRFIMSYTLHPYRPRFCIDINKFKDLFMFGKWILGSSVLAFLIFQGDDLFLGKMFGAEALGLYQMSYMISNLPNTDISQVISNVTFPAYSMMQDNITKLKEAYLKVLQIITFIAIPLSGTIYILSYEFVELLLTDKWLPIVPIIKILVLAGLMNTLIFAAEPVLNATGYPKIHTKWKLASLVSLVLTIYPLSLLHGLSGVAIAVLISNTIGTIGIFFEVKKILKFSVLKLIKIIIFPFASTAIFIYVISEIKNFVILEGLQGLMILLGCIILTYTFIIIILDNFFYYNMGKIIKDTFILLQSQTGKVTQIMKQK